MKIKKPIIDKPGNLGPSNQYMNGKLDFGKILAHGEDSRLFRSIISDTQFPNNEIGENRNVIRNNLYDFDNSTNGSE